jgi:competence protein ComEA
MNGIGSMRRRKGALASLALVAMALAVVVGPALAIEQDDAETAKNAPSRQIDINKATAVELTEIPGVGTVIAERIVDFRDKQGPFRRVEDLLKIRGIGEKSFQKIRPHVKVEENG